MIKVEFKVMKCRWRDVVDNNQSSFSDSVKRFIPKLRPWYLEFDDGEVKDGLTGDNIFGTYKIISNAEVRD